MGTMHKLYNNEPMALVYEMDSYFRQKPPDCSLFSRDGCEFPVHTELFYQTKFMRRMIKSFSFDQCQFDSCCKIQIMCPSVLKEELNLIIQFLYTGRLFCMNEQYANSIFTNLTKLFGFPSKNFDFNGTMIKGDPDGYQGFTTSKHESDEEYDNSFKNGNPEIQEQIDGLSKENRSLAREVAFLKETIKDLTDDFDFRSNQNEIKGIDKLTSGTKMSPITNLDFAKYEQDPGADEFLDTAGFMDTEYDQMDEDTEVKKEHVSDDDFIPEDNYYAPDPDYEDEEIKLKERKRKRKEKIKKKKKALKIAKLEQDEDGNPINPVPKQKRTYTCDQCETTFDRRLNLNEHMSEVHGVKYECNICQEVCKSNFSLNKHMINVHDIKKTYKCEICEAEFTAKSSLLDHERAIHDKTESHLCSFCGKNFNMKKNLRAHIAAIHEKKDYPCIVPGCDEGPFQSAFLLKVHTNLKHEGKKFECDQCKMEFKAKSSLARHMLFIHEGKVKSKFRCTLCDMQFAHKETLRKHTETVHEGKTYDCQFCHETFKSEYILQNHVDFSHQGKKGWECHLCQAQFKAKSSMEQHLKSVHEGVRDQICFLCGKAFVRQSDLNTHLKSVHEGKRRFQCPKCEKCYKSKQTLESHIEATHEGNKPSFKCQLCEKGFASPHTLKRHIEVVHEKKKPFGCNVCTARFGQKPNLIAHLKAVHSAMH